MATTGFWPVKNRLKEVIDYAENPDKTIEQKYLDDDLRAALRYVGDDAKTDRKMYVSAINCPVQRAYEHMMATKRQYGKLGGNVAYHGYQSFAANEVTPEKAHAIGMETARRMWGKDYQIVVTTHLNTDNIHNHIVINSVSFRTGRKFENHIRDHIKLRQISDEVCLEHGKSVLENSRFDSKGKKAYWVQKGGGLTHRDMLRRDIDEVISKTTNWRSFDLYLKSLGYRYARNADYAHPSIIAPGWKRAIRIDSLGAAYTQERIRERLIANQSDMTLYAVRIPKRYTPLMKIEAEYRRLQRMNGIQLMFELFITLLKLATGDNIAKTPVRPLSPALRHEANKLDDYMKQYKLLTDFKIETGEELLSFIGEMGSQIKVLEDERRCYRNQLRRVKTPELEMELKQKCRDLSAQIKPLRERKRLAMQIAEHSPKVKELLDSERQMEKAVLNRERKR